MPVLSALIPSIRERVSEMLQLLYPQVCAGCGSDLVEKNRPVCPRCFLELPETGFASLPGNPVEKIFYGRLALVAAHSAYYFSKDSVLQSLIHRLKYRGDQSVGEFLGWRLGESLLESGRFADVDAIIPMPLFPSKERQRGYNQAAVIAKGVSEAMGLPVMMNGLVRRRPTETQTRKQRTDRWLNVEGSFEAPRPELLHGKHLLLVDDVVTTGASLEAAGRVLAAIPGVRLSVATIALASKS
jgi:ComF family protein